jgi:hypothetical protein
MGNQQKEIKDEGKKMPEKKYKAGAISATIWQNTGTKDGKEFKYYSVSVERNYMDDNKEWKTTSSFRLNDLPRIKLLVDKVYDYLVLKEM